MVFSDDLGYGAFGLFQFTLVGLITGTAGLLDLAFVAPRWLPQRQTLMAEPLLQRYGLNDYISEIVIAPGSRLVGQSLQTSQLQRQFDMDVMELMRKYCCCLMRNLSALPSRRLGFGSVTMPRCWRFSKGSRWCAIAWVQFGDVLLVQGPKQSLLGLQTHLGFVLVHQREVETFRRPKAAIAIAILVGVVLPFLFPMPPRLYHPFGASLFTALAANDAGAAIALAASASGPVSVSVCPRAAGAQ